ncbi:MAG: ISAs1 family transposase [Pyrinomonadaceae bacterium]|nr:ISAs1 family transposase [Sphingobacteriaceae bacterium]
MDTKKQTSSIFAYFSEMQDFRINRKKRHLLTDIISITIAAALCGIESYNDIEDFGVVREDWLKTFLELPNGIPSHDTFNRVFANMDPIKFEACFRSWVDSILESHTGQQISIDGKTIRGAKSHGIKSPIHMVSAWASDSNLVLGQVKVSEKSNEITAIPELLKSLFIKDCLISIDAMGCQEDIATCIIEGKGDYLLAVKNNQSSLCQNMEDSFRFLKAASYDETIDVDHGRIETRTCTLITDLAHIDEPERWKNLSVLIKMESQRFIKATGKAEKSIHYYIASKPADAAFYQKNIRGHWAIENKLHWTLDVVYGEDADRKRNKHAAQNFSLINKVALNILKNDQTRNISIRRKKNIAAWDFKYLIRLLKF